MLALQYLFSAPIRSGPFSTMFTRFRIPLVALVLASPASLAAQSVQDFQLPPNPTPSASPTAQGPVDVESGSLPAAPRVIATPTPSPQPTATVQAIPSPQPSATQQAVRPAPARQTGTTPRQQPTGVPTGDTRLPVETGENSQPDPPSTPVEAPTIENAPLSSSTPAAEAASAEAGDADWLWPAIGGGILALLGLGYLVSQRGRNVAPPEIERPIVTGGNVAIQPGDLKLQAEAVKLTRSVMNATLHYRVSLLNRSSSAISDVTVGADIVSAHGGAPVEQQVASVTHPLEKRHTFARIAPGQQVRYEGQLSLPLSQVHAIRQGNAALFVPLLRLRVDGASEEPLVRTFVVGQGAQPGGRVTPFRIDEGPRSYEPVAARSLD